jgi:uncharacterized metal-binding protein YceD (DUF177 family)
MTETNPEFSRIVLVDQVPSRGMEMPIEANAAECAALARRFDLRSIEALSARLHLKAMAGGTIFRVGGHISARVVQTCVVTLEPIPATVEEDFDMTFGGQEDDDEGGELDLSFDDTDPPEPLADGGIDVGEAVAEHLALALDPFPRKAGAAFIEPPEAPIEEAEKPNPFAVLEQLRQKKG